MAITTYTYDGTEKKPTPTVKVGTTTLTAGTDYDVSYKDNINAGTATVTITGKGNYAGSVGSKTFTINKANGYVNLSATAESVQYGTASKTFNITSHHGGALSIAQTTSTGATLSLVGTTVTISSISTLPAGTKIIVRVTSAATVNYNSAYKDYTLTITAAGSASFNITLDNDTFEYDGTPPPPPQPKSRQKKANPPHLQAKIPAQQFPPNLHLPRKHPHHPTAHRKQKRWCQPKMTAEPSTPTIRM